MWTYWSSWGSGSPGSPVVNMLPIFRSDENRHVQRWKDGAWIDEPFPNWVTDEWDRGSGMVTKITPQEVAALDPRALL